MNIDELEIVSTSIVQTESPKFIENSLLVSVGLLAHMPLYFQLPRWANGLDPTFVHPAWKANFNLLALQMIAVHPLIWIAVIIAVFIRLCRNYGWTLAKRCPLPSARPPRQRVLRKQRSSDRRGC